VLAGPPAGVLADALGWRDFFILTVVAGVPGMAMLARFVPWKTREPTFQVAAPSRRKPLARAGLLGRAFAGTASAWLAGLFGMGMLKALGRFREGGGFDIASGCASVLAPGSVGDWLALLGIGVLALIVGLATAALLAARRGVVRRHGIDASPRA
jgi:PAT family beta-lactamase induction signal transducer AmpG